MEFSPKMQKIIQELAVKHEVDLTQSEAYLCLDLPGHTRLYVENTGFSRIFVGHSFEMNGDLVDDPSVVFFTGIEDKWIPINLTQFPFGFTEYVRVDEDSMIYNKADQEDLAFFTEEWAETIREQGWLDEGIRHIF